MNTLAPEFVTAVETKFADLETKAERFNAVAGTVEALEQEVIALKMIGAGGAGGGSIAKPEEKEHRKAFATFLRIGREEGLADLEAKALNTISGADGGFAVPELLDRNVQALLRDMGSLRSVANIVTIGGGVTF